MRNYIVILAMGVMFFIAITALPHVANAEVINDLFSTGIDKAGSLLTDGTDDPHYRVIAGPGSGPWPDKVGSLWPTWVNPRSDAGSKWIHTPSIVGRFTYRTTFTLPNNADLTTVRVLGRWTSDNDTRDVLINGNSLGLTCLPEAFGEYHSLSITKGFKHGLNTLDFVVFEGGGVTGLRVDDLRGTYALASKPGKLVQPPRPNRRDSGDKVYPPYKVRKRYEYVAKVKHEAMAILDNAIQKEVRKPQDAFQQREKRIIAKMEEIRQSLKSVEQAKDNRFNALQKEMCCIENEFRNRKAKLITELERQHTDLVQAKHEIKSLHQAAWERVRPLKEELYRASQHVLEEVQRIPENGEAHEEFEKACQQCLALCQKVRKRVANGPADKHTGLKLDVLVHLENMGDRLGHDNEFLGTRGESRRLEGFSININPPIANLGIRYMAHLEDIGDVPYQQNGEFIGTRGQSRRLEGFAIELTGAAAKKFDVLYMAHLQDRGDTPWCKNGQFCGTREESRRVEGISIRVVPRKKAQPGNNSKDLVSNFSFNKKGLILHYSFDKNEGTKVIDLSGQGNHGEVHGAKWTPEGHAGGAYAFDGQAHINVANPRFLDGCADATICAWIKCDLPRGRGGQIIASGDPRGGNDPISTRINTSSFEDFGFRDMLGEQDIKSHWGGALGVRPSSWQMLAITLESVPKGSIYKVYLDGHLVDHKKHPGRFAISYDREMPTQIGAIHGIQGWIGLIDEVKVFRRALSENEIRQIINKENQ